MKKKLLGAFLLLTIAAVADHDPDQEEAGSAANGFAIDLFHRNSPRSPFYDPALNESEILLRDILRSSARFTTNPAGEGRKETIVYKGGGSGYVIKIYVGTPPIEQLVAIDTGSSLVWIQCQPCNSCYKQDVQMFYKNQSQSYVVLLCNSATCDFYQSITNCRGQVGINYCTIVTVTVNTKTDYEWLVVDSGTPLTWLYEDFYDKVVAKVNQFMRKPPMDYPPHPFRFCYSHTSWGEVPELNFYFKEGSVRFTVTQVWIPWGLVEDDALCFLVGSHEDERNILGSRSQINLKIEYNVKDSIVSFEAKDCGVEDA
ncbi:hypothetical protein OROMI_014924 [Orobanche minor]